MGVYLLIIASVDLKYRGVYIIYDLFWRHSGLCKFAGFLSTYSSELSVVTLTVITIDRFISIIFPFRMKRLGMRDARIVMATMWGVVFALAAVPLMDIPYFENFYGRSGVCLALHITPQKPSGWQYSIFVFLALNMMSFFVIFLSYMWMFVIARRTRAAVRWALNDPNILQDNNTATTICMYITLTITHVVNRSFNDITGCVPDQMKVAKVVPVFKSSDRSSIKKIVLLVYSLTWHNIWYEHQCGFRAKHSTIDPIIHLINYRAEATNKDPSEYTLAIFCDLSKAFDVIHNKILLHKLKSYGIRGLANDWFSSYLSNRTQFA